ncbi:OsmC family protein [Corynebacterium comes]|uniref:OsmC-like protein n=1 Tax=Corynebacterium comes TaxID=2675218 RepID=A0A6B8VIG5_9CORY|nr:OsmC family protein [Corynebacterium comes]QGU05132.1 OsmC-like protein [Corynebacterium comes]
MAENIPTLTAVRTGPWTFTVDNGRGATVQIGMSGAPDSFSPVELLQAALAGCAALSGEAQLAHRLGEDFEMSSTVEATYNAENNRIEALANRIVADMSGLDAEKREKLIASTERSIAKLCTVKRSLAEGMTATTVVADKQG